MMVLDYDGAMDLFIRTGYCGCNSEFFEEQSPYNCPNVILTTCRICKKEHGRCYTKT